MSSDGERLSAVETEIKNLRAAIDRMQEHYSDSTKLLFKKIEDLKDEYARRLPLGATFYITLCTSLVVGLAVYTITH